MTRDTAKSLLRSMPSLRHDPSALREALLKIKTLAAAAAAAATSSSDNAAASPDDQNQDVSDADIVKSIKSAVDSAIDGFDTLQKVLDKYLDLVQYHCSVNESVTEDVISTIDVSCRNYSTTEKFLQTLDKAWFSQMLIFPESKQRIASELLHFGEKFKCPSIGLVKDIAAGVPDVLESITFPIEPN